MQDIDNMYICTFILIQVSMILLPSVGAMSEPWPAVEISRISMVCGRGGYVRAGRAIAGPPSTPPVYSQLGDNLRFCRQLKVLSLTPRTPLDSGHGPALTPPAF